MDLTEITQKIARKYQLDIEKLIIKGVKEKQKYLITITEFDKGLMKIKWCYLDSPFMSPNARCYDLQSLTEEDIKKYIKE